MEWMHALCMLFVCCVWDCVCCSMLWVGNLNEGCWLVWICHFFSGHNIALWMCRIHCLERGVCYIISLQQLWNQFFDNTIFQARKTEIRLVMREASVSSKFKKWYGCPLELIKLCIALKLIRITWLIPRCALMYWTPQIVMCVDLCEMQRLQYANFHRGSRKCERPMTTEFWIWSYWAVVVRMSDRIFSRVWSGMRRLVNGWVNEIAIG